MVSRRDLLTSGALITFGGCVSIERSSTDTPTEGRDDSTETDIPEQTENNQSTDTSKDSADQERGNPIDHQIDKIESGNERGISIFIKSTNNSSKRLLFAPIEIAVHHTSDVQKSFDVFRSVYDLAPGESDITKVSVHRSDVDFEKFTDNTIEDVLVLSRYAPKSIFNGFWLEGDYPLESKSFVDIMGQFKTISGDQRIKLEIPNPTDANIDDVKTKGIGKTKALGMPQAGFWDIKIDEVTENAFIVGTDRLAYWEIFGSLWFETLTGKEGFSFNPMWPRFSIENSSFTFIETSGGVELEKISITLKAENEFPLLSLQVVARDPFGPSSETVVEGEPLITPVSGPDRVGKTVSFEVGGVSAKFDAPIDEDQKSRVILRSGNSAIGYIESDPILSYV